MKVYPMKADAMVVKHPTAGPLKADGSDWPEDGFTFRMLVQDIITEDESKAWKAPAEAPKKAEAPKAAAPTAGTLHAAATTQAAVHNAPTDK